MSPLFRPPVAANGEPVNVWGMADEAVALLRRIAEGSEHPDSPNDPITRDIPGSAVTAATIFLGVAVNFAVIPMKVPRGAQMIIDRIVFMNMAGTNLTRVYVFAEQVDPAQIVGVKTPGVSADSYEPSQGIWLPPQTTRAFAVAQTAAAGEQILTAAQVRLYMGDDRVVKPQPDYPAAPGLFPG